ncbi:hypothetical protein KP509_05G085000 [Ceratopteris richardii]|uniref:Uncharacterized protein n=1 Tax=Ceratopteris richardii TaxID=49495 RepID=A0A8T2USI3_CERRI|nr:hypothetical protein KP509_05G085000 [Ceratopteris richardii]
MDTSLHLHTVEAARVHLLHRLPPSLQKPPPNFVSLPLQ